MNNIGTPHFGGLVTTSSAAFNSTLPVVMVSIMLCFSYYKIASLYLHVVAHFSLFSPTMLEMFPGYKERVQDSAEKLS